MSDDTDREHPLSGEDLVEIYAAGSEVEADRIVLLLEEEQVEAHKRETSVPVFPGAGSHRHLIVVFEKDRQTAVDSIKKAIEDQVLPNDGSFL